jgi:hypothetical protein
VRTSYIFEDDRVNFFHAKFVLNRIIGIVSVISLASVEPIEESMMRTNRIAWNPHYERHLNMAYSNTEKTIIMDDQYITPDRKHSTLIIIDVQQDFTLVGAAAEIPGTLQSVPHIRRLVQRHRELGLPIVHVIRLYHKERCRFVSKEID